MRQSSKLKAPSSAAIAQAALTYRILTARPAETKDTFALLVLAATAANVNVIGIFINTPYLTKSAVLAKRPKKNPNTNHGLAGLWAVAWTSARAKKLADGLAKRPPTLCPDWVNVTSVAAKTPAAPATSGASCRFAGPK